MNITWGDVRSAVHSKDYEMQARAYLWLNSNELMHYLCSQEQWMHATGFEQFDSWCHEIVNGNLERMASVAYMIMAGGHHQAWMYYAMERLRVVDNGPANAADVIWWWCSASDVLLQRLQDAGHKEMPKDRVWQVLAAHAAWEIMRPQTPGKLHESLALDIVCGNKLVCNFWPARIGPFDFQEDKERCEGKVGWWRLSDRDWVCSIELASDCMGRLYHVDLERSDEFESRTAESILSASHALGKPLQDKGNGLFND